MSEITSVSSDGPVPPTAPLGVYVHVPFCASTCDFCAFYQTQPTADGVGRFLAGIESEADLVVWPREVATVFWGGGTPGLLSPDALRRLGEGLRRHTRGAPGEWTVEMAPASVTAARLAALKDVGVTRISMGVQSFQPALLDALGRQHTVTQVHRAYERIRAAGFHSVNLDLMFALPGQDEAAWMSDLETALALAPDHLSTYCLTFEEDTRLWVKLSEGKVKLDPDREALLYKRTWERLESSGYAQYEVSNFARPGHRCIHNVNTWRMSEWVGLGPSAASQHAGWRGANVADLDLWLERVGRAERMTEDRVVLTADLLCEDALIFGLRMNDGVDLGLLRTRFPRVAWPSLDLFATRLTAEGLATLADGHLCLTTRGRLVADSVGAGILDAFASESLCT